MEYCRECGFDIVPGGRSADVKAQKKRFCSADCEAVYAERKRLDIEHTWGSL